LAEMVTRFFAGGAGGREEVHHPLPEAMLSSADPRKRWRKGLSRWWINGILIVLGIILAERRSFVCDDAFISFRYARNLAEGHGLVYNLGERVEGYTNFLWTLLLSSAFPLDLDIVKYSLWLGLGAFAGSLVATVSLTNMMDRPPTPFSLALLGCITNATFLSFATGGLETSLFTLELLMMLVFLGGAWRLPTTRNVGAFSVIGVLLMMTRPDGAIFYGIGSVSLVSSLRHRLKRGSRHYSMVLAWILPPILLYLPYLLWKYSYYGSLVPNTYYAKAADQSHFRQGIAYLAQFLWSYPMIAAIPFTCIMFYFLRCHRRGQRSGRDVACPMVVTLVAMAGVFFLYVAKVGGDFMEFRLLAPLVPVLFLVLDWTLLGLPRAVIASVSLAVVMIALLLWHPPRILDRMETVDGLAHHINVQRWGDMGFALLERLPSNSIIATTAAGALPYFSRLQTVDMLGLNDAHVAHLDMDMSKKGATIGHVKFANDSYLRRRGVNFVFAWPRGTVPFSSSTPTSVTEIIVRLWGDRGLRGRYLVTTTELDALLRDTRNFKTLIQ
jgi:arabinofuranosyltransferase